MSPTLNYGSAGHGTNVQSSTQTSGNAQPEGMGFELRATGGALDGVGQREQTRSSGEASQVSTTGRGGESDARLSAPHTHKGVERRSIARGSRCWEFSH